MKNVRLKLTVIISNLVVFLVLFSNVAFPDCPAKIDTAYELRSQLRTVIFQYLSNPDVHQSYPNSGYTKGEILTLLNFYKNEKGKSLITACDASGVTPLLGKTLDFETQCNDKVDNDGDRKIDLNDAGCTSISDNDETNCGDKVCDGSETCSSCSFDCCPSPGILFMKSLDNVISFNDDGNVALKGTIQQNSNPVQTADDEFIVRDINGADVAIINLITGNMVIKGSLFSGQSALTPSGSSDDFVVKDPNGNVISYIDEQGNFYLKGTLIENGNP